MIISIAIYGFGGCVTFLVIIGDQIQPVASDLGFVFIYSKHFIIKYERKSIY